MITIDYKSFFNPEVIKNDADRTIAKAYMKFGAFVRADAKQSIRKRKSSAKPGNPPSSHEGSLKRLIFFNYDRVGQSVIIGPYIFKRYGERTGAEVLEVGGSIRTTEGKKQYSAFPYMQPQFNKHKERINLFFNY